MSPLLLLTLSALLVLVVAGGVAVLMRDTRRWLQSQGPQGCTSVSTRYGAGRDARPDGLRCYKRPDHRGKHLGVDPNDGRTWTWDW